MTTTVAEADQIMAAAAKKGVKVVASPGMMLYPHNQRIRRLILNQALGRLAWVLSGASGVGDYHMHEEYRTGQDILTDVDPSWYFQKPGGGPQYDVTVYCLHALTGIFGPARRVTAMSGIVVPERDYHGQPIACNMDDTTMLTLDFGNSLFAMLYATVQGGLTEGFQPNIYGRKASIIGTRFGDLDLKLPYDFQPHVTGEHQHMAEYHVFEDMLQLADWVRDGTPSIVTMEHARHVIEIIEAGYTAARTGQAQDLHTTFHAFAVRGFAGITLRDPLFYIQKTCGFLNIKKWIFVEMQFKGDHGHRNSKPGTVGVLVRAVGFSRRCSGRTGAGGQGGLRRRDALRFIFRLSRENCPARRVA